MSELAYQAISCSLCGKFLCWTRQVLKVNFLCDNCKVHIIKRQKSLSTDNVKGVLSPE